MPRQEFIAERLEAMVWPGTGDLCHSEGPCGECGGLCEGHHCRRSANYRRLPLHLFRPEEGYGPRLRATGHSGAPSAPRAWPPRLLSRWSPQRRLCSACPGSDICNLRCAAHVHLNAQLEALLNGLRCTARPCHMMAVEGGCAQAEAL